MKIRHLLSYEVGDLAALARPAWDWWVEEILSLTPAFLHRHLRLMKRHLIVEIDNGSIVASRLGQMGSAGLTSSASPYEIGPISRRDVPLLQADKNLNGTVICLPPIQVVRRPARYPQTSPRNLRQMIALDLTRLSPLDPSLVYFGFRQNFDSAAGETEGNWANVEIWICRRTIIDRALVACRDLDLTPIAVTLAECLPAGIAIENILPRQRRRPLDRLRRARTPALAALAFGLAVCVSAVSQWREADFDRRLENELKNKRAVVQTIEKDQAQAQRLERRKDFLQRQRQGVQPGAILAELARLLPDDAWLYSLEYGKDEWRLRGFASRANELIPALDSSRLLSAAQFRSPIVQAPGGGADRFDIATRAAGAK